MTISSGSLEPWKHYSSIMEEGLVYIHQRATKKIQSLKTCWSQFDSIGLNGLEWNSLYVIAARPGVGKTLIASNLTKDLEKLNPDQDFNILHLQFEMLGRNMAVRELSSANNLDIRYIQSAQDSGMPALTSSDFDKMKNYVNKTKGRKEFIIDKALTVNEIKSAIASFYNKYNKPFVVTLDHTLLVVKAAHEKDRQDTLNNLAIALAELKNKYPVIFIILSQLNREIDDAERQKPGQLSNYPTEKDVFGSDALLQCADVMIAFNRPAKYNLQYYGPLKYIIKPTDKYLLALHVLKNRYGNVSIQWYRADYSSMKISEALEPDMAVLRKTI